MCGADKFAQSRGSVLRIHENNEGKRGTGLVAKVPEVLSPYKDRRLRHNRNSKTLSLISAFNLRSYL